jgi:phage shock protein E
MRKLHGLMAPLLLAITVAPAAAQERLAPVNPQIDYAAFGRLVAELGPLRDRHRLSWPEFSRAAAGGQAILLDARSADAFARGHLKGAVNLPFTDFTAEALRAVLGDDPDRAIYIYCNNNFRDHRAPVPLKAAPLALNIPMFINLHGYGYRNVWELADVIGSADDGVAWEASPGS